jgi:HK97 family phage major capsid protein/HK97 family phage prohead protease
METLELELKFATGETGLVSGYASLFGKPKDAVNDIVSAGAFDRSLANGRRPQMLREHKGEAVGEWTDLQTDELGLRVKGRLNLETAAGRAAYDALQRGEIDGLSIGYIATKADRDGEGNRVLQDVDLREISLVKRPASSRARVLSVKSDETAAKGAANHEEEGQMAEETKTGAPADGAGEDTEVKDRLASVEKTVNQIKSVTDDMNKLSERTDNLEAKLNRPGVGQGSKDDGENVEHKAFVAFVRNGVERMDPNEVKNLNVSTDTAGGYLAPEQFSNELQRNLVEISPFRQAARISNTGAGSVKFPTRTANTTASWVGETASRSSSEPTFDQVEITAHELATYTDVSNILLEDSIVDVAAELRRDMAESFGKAEAVAFLNGSGSGQPEGVLQNSDVPVKTDTSSNSLTVDDLIAAFYDLPAFYRNRAVWMANGATIAALRTLKNGSGDYIWREAIAEGSPNTLLGRPIVEAPDLPDIGTGNTPIIFGDFQQGYRILDRVGLSVLRDPYTQQTSGLVRFHARRRVGGKVLKAEAMRLYQNA